MAIFSFEKGLKQTIPTIKKRTTKRTKRVYGAPCLCFESGLDCHHRVKERSTGTSDATKEDTRDKTPAWQRHFAVERNQNTQRYKAG